jgi:hypothetical protein
LVGKALAAWRSDLLDDLGGAASISTQEAAIVDAAVKTKLILDSVDAWLLSQPALVSKRNRSVLPAVRDRNALVATLRGLLSDLGLRRRAREEPSLAEIAAEYAGRHGHMGCGKSDISDKSPGDESPERRGEDGP